MEESAEEPQMSLSQSVLIVSVVLGIVMMIILSLAAVFVCRNRRKPKCKLRLH